MPARPLAPDLVLTNARIHTIDAHDRVATSIAVKDGRIVGVGGDDEMRALAGFGTIEENLGGAVVVPGLIDPHNHMLGTGIMLSQVQLYDCRSIDEILARIAARVAALPPGAWVVGRGWDESLLAERRHPSRHDLDRVSPHHPVVIHRVWNKLVANSAALAAAGISRETPDPPAGENYSGSFDRDADGHPTGLFRDRAKMMITDHIPPASPADLVDAIATACRAYNAVGIVGVAEPGLFPHELRAYSQALRDRRLSIRTDLLIAAWGFGHASEDPHFESRIAGIGIEGGLGTDMLRLEGVKLMPDGGISDRTARMLEPYLDDPDNFGQWIVPPDELRRRILQVHDLSFPMDIHTCGSATQQLVVEAYIEAQRANPKPWLRHRVHHAYFPTPETIAAMAQHRIPAIVSSPFITHLGEGFVAAVGPERAASVMPMRAYIDAGVPLAGSSDSAITDYNPWVGMQAAVTRTTIAGRVLGPEQAITPREALRSYTIGAAYATGKEGTTGSIEVGKRADLVIVDRDPLAIPGSELAQVRAVATMLGGAWVHDTRG